MAKDNEADGELTPLQRYLAKQKADAAAVPPVGDAKTDAKAATSRFWSSTAAQASTSTSASMRQPVNENGSERVSSAPEPRGSVEAPREQDSAPQAPPTDSAPFWRARSPAQDTPWSAASSATGSATGVRSKSAVLGAFEPAPFFRRAIAYFIDLFIISKLTSILTFSSVAGFYFSTNISEWLYSPIQFLVLQAVTFVYFGWFYREKGATPGKMIFGLEVSTDAALSGDERLSYIRSYLRETIGKFLSTILLCMGFFLALFRKDHRALHDLLFETTVVKRLKNSGGA